ncbi:MAG: tripartite tricarboxylate transporter TctB family protein [Lachnospiraceae bacterium]|nr:tripartite tricarboxylate transporter TctB family protein [Lachnospiraceae bacterium]
MYKENKIVAAVVFAVFAAAGIMAFKFNSTAKIFPLFCCALGMIFSVAEFISVVLKERKNKPVHKAKSIPPEQKKRMLIMFGLITAYIILITVTGWTVATLLFMLAVSLIMGVPGMSRVKIIIISVVVVAIFFLIFKVFMHINLPTGFLI